MDTNTEHNSFVLESIEDGKPRFVKLIEKTKVSHDSYIFVFELPFAEATLGLGVGHCIILGGTFITKEHPEGTKIFRKYTPISRCDMKGRFELIIKIYRAGVHPSYPEGGKLTPHLENLKIGDTVEIFDAKKKFTYTGLGEVKYKVKEIGKLNKKIREIGLIAGGSGIAPIYQVMRHIADNPDDKTQVRILFANKSSDDILIQDLLDKYAKDPRVKVFYTLDKGPEGWKGFTGFITKEMLKETMPSPAKDVVICFSGPKPMNKMLQKQLEELGYDPECIFKF